MTCFWKYQAVAGDENIEDVTTGMYDIESIRTVEEVQNNR